MPVDSDTGKQIAILEKKIRILERKLQRSEESRKQIESVKDRSDHFQKSVIEETKEQQRQPAEQVGRGNHAVSADRGQTRMNHIRWPRSRIWWFCSWHRLFFYPWE